MIFGKNIIGGIVAAGLLFLPVAVWPQAPTGGAELPVVEEGPGPGLAKDEAEPVAQNPEEEKVYLNVQDQDIKDVIKAISKATGRNFIIDSKVSGKISILSNKMMTAEEAYQAFLSALSVAGFTTVEGPAGILKVISLRDAKNFPIPTHVDTTPDTDNFVTRLIKLENISANDMAEAIKGLLSRNGNLFPYTETNTLVLTDSGTNINRLMKIIKELDQEGPQEVVEIIPIHFASAKELASIVLSLYEQQGGGARGGRGAQPANENIPKVSKLIADERTNAIIVLASKREIDKVKALLNRLDAKLEEGQEGKIHVHYLKYAKAKDIASVIQGLSGQVAKPPGKGAGDSGAVIASLEDFKVASDDATNSLLITANAKTYRTLVEKVLAPLDIPRKQVYLEAMVLEFSLSHTKSIGITSHAGGGSSGLLGFGQTFGQLAGLFDPFTAGSSLLSAPGLLGGVLSRKTVTVTAADGKTITLPAFSAFITALDSFGDTNLVASPNLLALDNEEASIEIIRKEPEPGQTLISATGLQQLGKPERIEAGLRLTLTPQITAVGTVRMAIDQQFSSFATAKNTSLGTQAIVERKVKTSVVTNDGQTVVIGGLMEDQVTVTKTKIPILGDIPLLGWLFRKKDTGKSKSNLLLFITPHIIRDNSDFERVLRRKMGQQERFLSKNYKKKQRRNIGEMVEDHDSDIMRLGKPVAGADSRTLPVEYVVEGGTGAGITAAPDEEKHVTIILPSSRTPSEESAAPVPQEESEQVEAEPVIQPIEIEPASPGPEALAPFPAPEVELVPTEPFPVPQEVPLQSSPMSDLPQESVGKQVEATPVPAPEPQVTPKKKRKQEPHAPVISLPPGTPPDLWE